jgi:hypothetical protein
MAWMPPPTRWSVAVEVKREIGVCTCALEHEAEYVAGDEELGEPFLAYEGVLLAVDEEDDAS